MEEFNLIDVVFPKEYSELFIKYEKNITEACVPSLGGVSKVVEMFQVHPEKKLHFDLTDPAIADLMTRVEQEVLRFRLSTMGNSSVVSPEDSNVFCEFENWFSSLSKQYRESYPDRPPLGGEAH
ncbi:hypothetical protein [Gimesia sp.]|uniref:hypothetical protein n=1 Tax=Gimesia sp. TaxID=2024833 RepID=UPI0032EEA95A